MLDWLDGWWLVRDELAAVTRRCCVCVGVEYGDDDDWDGGRHGGDSGGEVGGVVVETAGPEYAKGLDSTRLWQ